MEDELTDSESVASIDAAKTYKANFNEMLKLCRLCNKIPNQYIQDMIKMYKNCNENKQMSKKLCMFISNGLKHISEENENSFQFAADIYNELLQLTTKSQNEKYNASTSNRSQIENEHSDSSEDEKNITSNSSQIENELNDSIEDNKSKALFKNLIQKCYQNPNFPNPNIEVIDKLYDSISAEFTDSEFFLLLLKEANQSIWPDSKNSSYFHIEHIYEQLKQFQTSMAVQDRKISVESKEINEKKFKMLEQLKAALKLARKKIKALDMTEMDINDDDIFGYNSPYILKDKFEKRVVEIYQRICKLRDEPDYLEQPPLHFKKTNNKLVNKCIEKYYNTNRVFPDYFEVYTLLKLLNEKKKLNWTESELKNIAHNAFLQLGKQLKMQRLNEYFGRLSNITFEKDPAEENEELRKKLDESNKKFHADLDKVSEKFINKQRYAEETEGSNLSDSDCEISSEDECIKSDNEYLEYKPISIKRKKIEESEDEDKSTKKNKTTIEIESINSSECAVVLEKLNNDEILNKMSVVPKKVNLTNTNAVINEKNIHNESPTTTLPSVNTSKKENLKNDSAEDKSVASTENDGLLVIDEDIGNCSVDPISTEKNVNEGNKDSPMDNNVEVDIDSSLFLEPEVVINEENDSVIEINENDDSDVEIISCSTPIAPVKSKKSIENLIKSFNFEKKYNWTQIQKSTKPSNPPNSMHVRGHHQLGNPIQHSNPKFVNRWVDNAPIYNKTAKPKILNFQQSSKTLCSNNGLHSMVQRCMTQTQSRFSNSIGQPRHVQLNAQPAHQQLLQQQVTTMTTTTTVRQIIQQQASERIRQQSSETARCKTLQISVPTSLSNDNPELIELD